MIVEVVQLPRSTYYSIAPSIVAMEDNRQGRTFYLMEARAIENVRPGSSFQSTESKTHK